MTILKFHWHWPLTLIESMFIDIVSGETVFRGRCECGKEFMTNGRWETFKVPLKERSND
ncbi:MAG: hypothetical protein ACREBR_04815 [bacterium]